MRGSAICTADAGYRGHNAPPEHKFKVYTSGQKRRVTPQIKREFKRRAAIEPSSAISRNITAWVAITSHTQAATPSMPCSLPPATTSAASSHG
jgi:IS5 family transposase